MKPTVTLMFMLMASTARADVYVLGSSYSWDALPEYLDDRSEWHIDCGKSLQYIFDNPLTPCEPSSTIWPVALPATRFDHISFQPVGVDASTERSDLDTIGDWLSMQPDAVAVIHPTWPFPANWESEFHDADPDNTHTNYSQRYAFELIKKLESANPGRRFVSDRANEILDSIYHDIQNGVGPLTDFRQLFRDESGHMSTYGQYVQHNALRQSFAERTGIDSTPDGVPPEVRQYLDARIKPCRPAYTTDNRRQEICDPWSCSTIGRVGPAGGAISSLATCPDHGVTIHVPEGAFGDTVELSIMNTSVTRTLDLHPPDFGQTLSSVKVGPDGLQLGTPATITFHWREFPGPRGGIDGTGPTETDLAIFKNGARVAVCGLSDQDPSRLPYCDTRRNAFTIELDGAGEFRLAIPRPTD